MKLTNIINELTEIAGDTKLISIADVAIFAEPGSESYFEIERALLNLDIDIVSDEEFDDVEIIIDEDELMEINVGETGISMNQEASAVQTDDPVKMYLRDMGQFPLLTRELELKYATQVSHGHYAREQLDEYDQGTLHLEQKDIKELKNIIKTAAAAKDRIIEGNLRLVVSIAKRHIGRGLLFLDLIQEGNMGLMRAVDKFDYEKGYRFSTYATWWIRQAISRAVSDQARTIRIPVHMVEQINKMSRIQRELTQELGRDPELEEIAEKMETTVERVEHIQRVSKEPISLERKVGEEEESSLGDFIPDIDTLTPHEHMLQEMVKTTLDEVLETLTDREEKVLRMRFGLLDGKVHTLEEVGIVFGVTRERIRQIEAKALRKLRSPSRKNKLKEFYN